jgi:hypothetical protein
MMPINRIKQVKRAKRTTMTIFNEDAYEHPALCIPRGLGKISHSELTSIIRKTGLGEIYKVIIKPREFILPEWERTVASSTPQANIDLESKDICINEDRDRDRDPDAAHKVVYSNIYIYFKKWNTDNPTVRKYRNNLINGQSIKIVHNTIPTPIFWRCVAANFHRR